ncbi:hypothetical protein Tco_1185368 [Tanacetum coccineum]
MNRYFRLNPDVDVGLELWRDVNMLCHSLHSDDVEDFWRTQDDWIVCSWKLYPKSFVHVLDLTNGKTVYMFVDKVYPIRATLLERMLRHRLTVPPSYYRDVVVAGSVIQMVQTGLQQSYECLASAPLVSACTARQMVFSSPWLTAKKESGSSLQTALWLVQEDTALGKDLLKSVDGCQLTIYSKLYGYRLTMFHVQRVDMVINPPWNLPFLGAKGLTSPEQTATGKGISNPLMAVMVCPKPYGIQLTNVSSTERVNTPGSDENRLQLFDLMYILVNGAVAAKSGSCCLRDVAASFDSAVHRVHAVSFDAAVASIVSAACFVPADSLNSIPADYVSAGHVLVPADSHDESSSLYAELGLTKSDTESDEEVPPIVKSGAPDEGRVGPNPSIQNEGQAGANPGNDTVSHTLSTLGVHTGPNLEHTDAQATNTTSQPQLGQMDEDSTRTLSSLQHLAKGFSFGDQFFNDKPPEANNEKAKADTKVESMVSITIHQDTSAIPPMTLPVIDLVSVPDSPTIHRPLPTTITATATTTTITIMTTIPLPPQPQQVSLESILINRLGELEQHIANLVDANQALEERLDKHGSRLYRLENQHIPNQVSKVVDDIVMDVVNWAMHAPLRESFRDLPEADMKEILHNRMWESKSYQTHEDHMTLYESLEKSMARDNRDQLLSDLAEARKKKKKRWG